MSEIDHAAAARLGLVGGDLRRHAALTQQQRDQIAFAEHQQRTQERIQAAQMQKQIALQIVGMDASKATIAPSVDKIKESDPNFYALRERAIQVLGGCLEELPQLPDEPPLPV